MDTELNHYNFPTEEVELPSKGLLYPLENPLSKGVVVMKYMTAKEEDILTNENYIRKGTVLDKLIQSLLVTKIDYNSLLTVDRDALLVAIRILGYGKDYSFTYGGKEHTVDLTTLASKELETSAVKPNTNEFKYIIPSSGTNITFKLLTHADELAIEKEIQTVRDLKIGTAPTRSTRLKYIITSVEGNKEPKVISEFVNNLLARDAKDLRQHIKNIEPGIILKTEVQIEEDLKEEIDIPLNINFFWPEY